MSISATVSNANLTGQNFTATINGVPSNHYVMTKEEYRTGTKTNYAFYNTYDTNGLITKKEQDFDGNGTIDTVMSYTYDANGNNTRINYDEDNNGSIDATMSYTWQKI